MKMTKIAVALGLMGTVALAVSACATEMADHAAAEQELRTPIVEDCAALCQKSAATGCEAFESCYAECTNVDPIRPECVNLYADFVDCGAHEPDGLTCTGGVTQIRVADGGVCAAQYYAMSACQAGPSPMGVRGLCSVMCDRIEQLECAYPLASAGSCYSDCATPLSCQLENQRLIQCYAKEAPEQFYCVDFPEWEVSYPWTDSCMQELDNWFNCLFGYAVP